MKVVTAAGKHVPLTREPFALRLGLLLLAGCASSAPADEIITRQEDGFSVVHRQSLPVQGVDEVARQTSDAIQNVSAWLAQAESHVDATHSAPIRVLIDPDKHTPTQIRSTIFVPEGRVRSRLDDGTIVDGDFGIVHEITHVLARSAYREERNRFYDDGLAVYLQNRFGPPKNYPNFGQDLHVATATLAATYGGLLPLQAADQARRVTDNPDLRRLGYLQLGSFTAYLIENFGIDAYFRIYHGASLDAVTGAPRAELEQRWSVFIKSFQ